MRRGIGLGPIFLLCTGEGGLHRSVVLKPKDMSSLITGGIVRSFVETWELGEWPPPSCGPPARPPPPPAPNVISPTTTPTARPTLPWVAGVVITVTSQWVVDADFADKSAHVVPWVKFSSTLLYALVSRRSAPTPQPTARQLRLMGLVGLLDAAAYTTYCVGFYICGATLSGILLPGLSQVLTATATRFVLGRHLSRGQALGISCVLAGLATRALPPELFGQTSTAGAAGVASKAAGSAEEREQLLGAGLIALSAVLYSGLGITYDKLVRGAGEKPPAHADVMWHTSKLGKQGWLFEEFSGFSGGGGGARALILEVQNIGV